MLLTSTQRDALYRRIKEQLGPRPLQTIVAWLGESVLDRLPIPSTIDGYIPALLRLVEEEGLSPPTPLILQLLRLPNFQVYPELAQLLAELEARKAQQAGLPQLLSVLEARRAQLADIPPVVGQPPQSVGMGSDGFPRVRPYFDQNRLQRLANTAIECEIFAHGIQDALLAGIHRRFVASLPQTDRPDERLLRTLAQLNETGSIHGTLPLRVWLSNARSLTQMRVEAALFEESLAILSRMGEREPLPPEPPAAARSRVHYPDTRTADHGARLEVLYELLRQLQAEGADTSKVLEAILELKRKLRNGSELSPGYMLAQGRYQLLVPLGMGGFGSVWRARDRERNTDVAIKVLHAQHSRGGERLERFRRGANRMAELSHQHIVRVLQGFETEASEDDSVLHYFVMEFIEGATFKALVLEGKLSLQERLDLVIQIATALEHAHARGITHRDVTPDNILVSTASEGQSRVAKLTDFDLVWAEDTTGGTEDERVMGKYFFAEPEAQGRGLEEQAQADVYSLGMTAVFAVHAQPLTNAVLLRREQFLGALECPDSIREVLARATRPERKGRYPGMEAFRTALEHALQARPSRRLSAGLRRHPVKFAAGALMLCALGAATVRYAGSSRVFDDIITLFILSDVDPPATLAAAAVAKRFPPGTVCRVWPDERFVEECYSEEAQCQADVRKLPCVPRAASLSCFWFKRAAFDQVLFNCFEFQVRCQEARQAFRPGDLEALGKCITTKL